MGIDKIKFKKVASSFYSTTKGLKSWGADYRLRRFTILDLRFTIGEIQIGNFR